MTSKEIAELKAGWIKTNPLSTPYLILEVAYQLAVANELKKFELQHVHDLRDKLKKEGL